MPGKIRFGVFELDVDATELRKHGSRVRLQEQPFQVLAYLLERPGQVVTREELKKRIWAGDTFVDFDQSLNKAVNRLREALNDSAGQPRYVETVPRRGYRFVAPVTGLGGDNGSAPPVTVEEPPALEAHPNGRHRFSRTAVAAIAGAAVLLVLGLVAWLRVRHPESAVQRTPIRVTRNGLADQPTISRDGKLLAYASTAGGVTMHIWVRQVAGGEPLQVTKGTDDETWPDFSPDGTQIAFRSERDGGGIYTASTLGGGEPQLLVRRGKYPRFSPSGEEILFFSDDPYTPRAYTVPVQGGAAREIFPDWLINCGFWSPGGKAILFNGARKRDPKSWQWMLAQVAGGEPAEFHLPGDNYHDSRFPAPSAWRRATNGRSEWIVYGSGSGDTYNLFRVAVANGKIAGTPEQITSAAGVSLQGDLSPDGNFVFTFGTYGGQIWIVPADTNRAQTLGQPEQVTQTEGVLNGSPSLSRDGRWLGYTATNSVTKETSLRVRDLTSGAERQVLDGPFVEWTSISPDGTQLAYTQETIHGTADIGRTATFVIRTNGGVPARLCRDCDPRGFSSDGSILLTQQGFSAGGQARAVAIRIADGAAKDFLGRGTAATLARVLLLGRPVGQL